VAQRLPHTSSKRQAPAKGRPIARRVLREDIRDELMEEILSGRRAPGSRLVETRIASDYGVSQAPVREALRDLEMYGFIVSSPFKGAVVRQSSPEELVQIYPIRAVLEGLAAREAASRMTPALLARLEKYLVTMRKAAARGQTRKAVEADFAFHLTIVEASGNGLLTQFWERMRLATSTFLTVSRSRHSLVEIAERHRPVLDALRAGEPAEAERAMRRHIEEPGRWLQSALDEDLLQPRHEGAKRRGATTARR
jgi:DNA-binding GntR family transcriptional regulator